MATLAEIREQYPQYSDLSDAALADALYGKFYSDIPRKEFNAKLGLKTGPSRPPIGGIAGALGMGVEAPLSSVRTGIESLFGGNAAVEAGLGRKAKLGEKYAEQPGFEQVKKAYEERGIFPAIGEYISQVPAALAEQTPQMAATIGAARVGGAFGGLPGAITGAVAPSFTQMYGGFLERQAEEQKARGEPVDVNRLTAALSAVPAAALDVAATFIPLGRSLAGAVFGKNVERMLAKGSEKGAEKLAKEGLAKSLAKGTAVGALAEIPTEVAQQMIERAQAGLSLVDQDALTEYGQTAFQVSKLAPFGAAGRLYEKGAAKDIMAERQRTEEAAALAQQEQVKAQQEAEQAEYRKTDDYLDTLEQRYGTFIAQMKTLDDKLKVKPAKGDLVAQADNEEARTASKELVNSDETRALVDEYRQPGVRERLQARQEQRQLEQQTREGMQTKGAQAQLFEAPEVKDRSPLAQIQALAPRIQALDTQIAAAQKTGNMQQVAELGNQRNQLQESLAPLLPSRADLTSAQTGLERFLKDAQDKMVNATSTQDVERHANTVMQHKAALEQLQAYEPFVEAAPAGLDKDKAKLKKLTADLDAARQLGDAERVLKLAPQIRDLESRIGPELFTEGAKKQRVTEAGEVSYKPEQADLFGFEYPEITVDKALAEAMAQGREQSTAGRKKVEAELQAFERMTQRRGQSPAQQALAQLRLEEAKKLRDSFAKKEQDWAKLEKEPDNLRHQDDRDKQYREISKRIRELEAELEQAPVDLSVVADDKEFLSNLGAIKNRALGITPTTPAGAVPKKEFPQNVYGQSLLKIQEQLEAAKGQKKAKIQKLYNYLTAGLSEPEIAKLVAESTPEAAPGMRVKSDVAKELETARESLADVEKRIAIGEKRRRAAPEQSLEDLTDERVADLLDRLLPGAIEKTEKPPQITRTNTDDGGVRTIVRRDGKIIKNVTRYRYKTTSEQDTPLIRVERDNKTGEVIAQFEIDGRSFGDLQIGALVEQGLSPEAAIKRVLPDAEKLTLVKPEQQKEQGTAKRVQELPIESARRLAQELQDNERLLDSLNDQIKRAGKPKGEKLDALNALKEQRSFLQNENANLRKAYDRLVSLEQPAYKAKEQEPTTGDLFGPLEEARKELGPQEKRLQRLMDERDALVAEQNRRNQTASTPQLQELLDKFSKLPTGRLKELDKQIDALGEQLGRTEGRVNERYSAFVQAREAERVADDTEDALPSLEQFVDRLRKQGSLMTDDQLQNLYWSNRAKRDDALNTTGTDVPDQRTLPQFGLAQYVKTKQEVPKEELDAARTKYVDTQNLIESLRKALSATDSDGGKALRDLATKLQTTYENRKQFFSGPKTGFQEKQYLQYKTERERAYYESLPGQVKKLLNMANLAQAAKKTTGNIPKDLQTRLEKAQEEQTRAKEKLDVLEKRQRAYEQQQDVITGAAPGQREADRLKAGAGYRTATGKVRTKPTKKASWGVESVPKTKEAKPSEVAKAAAEMARAANLVKAAERLAKPTTVEVSDEITELRRQYAEANKVAEGYLFGDIRRSGVVVEAAVRERTRLAELIAESIKRVPTTPSVVVEAQNKLDLLSRAVKALDPAANGTFAPEKTVDVMLEMERLQNELGEYVYRGGKLTEQQLSGAAAAEATANLIKLKGADTPAALIRTAKDYELAVNRVDSQLTELRKSLDKIKTEFDLVAKNEATVDGESARKAPVVVEAKLAELIEKATPVDAAHTKAVALYKVARRDLLMFQYEMGKGVRQQYADAVAALQAETERQAKDPALAAVAKRNESNAAVLAQLQERLAKSQAALDKARAKERATPAPDNRTAEQKADDERQDRLEQLLKAPSAELAALPGTRIEVDTTGQLAQAVQNNAKRMLGLSQAALEKAVAKNDVAAVQKATADVQRYEKELAQALPAGERVTTAVGEEAAAGTPGTQPVVEGTRLGARRVGPLVRQAQRPPGQMLTGSGLDVKQGSQNPPRQAGAVRLRSYDLSPEAANAISLATLNKQVKAAEGDRKATLQAQYALQTEGLTKEQIAERLAEGKRLIGSDESMALIAQRENLRQAIADLNKARTELNAAETAAEKSGVKDSPAVMVAQDALDQASDTVEMLEKRISRMREAEQASKQARRTGATAEQEADSAVEEDVDKNAPVTRSQKAVGDFYFDEGDVAPTQYKTALGTQLSDRAIEEINDGSLIYALNDVAKNGATPLLRENAAKVAQFVRQTKVQVVSSITIDGKQYPAAYDPATNTVLLTQAGMTQEDLVHEVTHAATMRVIEMPEKDLTPLQRQAKRELEAMLKAIKGDKKFEGEYATADLKEFVSEAQSNDDLRTKMEQKPWFRGNMLVRAIRRFLNLIGFDTQELMTTRAQELIETIYMPSRSIQGVGRSAAAARPTSTIVGYEPTTTAKIKGNFYGLAGRVQLVDRLAAADAAIVAAEGADKLTSVEAFQAQYFMRMADKVTQAAGQFVTSGPVRIVADKRTTGTEYRYESVEGANLLRVSEHLEQATKASGRSADDIERMFTVLSAGARAEAIPNGWIRLNTGDAKAAKAEYDADKAYLNANPKVKQYMDAAAAEYRQYNAGLLDFAAQCDFLTPEEATRLKRVPYAPYYRVEDGMVKLFVEDERPIKIGNIKDNPDLQRMIGDNTKIMPILTSAVQNTYMLTRAALDNKAAYETSNAMYKAGFASKYGPGQGPANADTVHFKVKGKPYFATIDSDTFGIPAHLIVKGMEGIKTTLPQLVQMLGVPADILRKFITRSPAYAVRQIIRDPINAALLSGTDGVPVLNAIRQLAKMRNGQNTTQDELMRGLVVSSNVYTGNEKDMEKFLQDIQSGKGKWTKMMGMIDSAALQADVATRALVYESALKRGLSKAQAQFVAMESQNFGRRGLSPSMQMLSTMVPFFNAQIQGLDVLYRTLRGKMPFAQQMEIQRKLKARGMMLMAGAMAYAIMMQDDEAYKLATPEQRYGNFFVYIPGVKDPLRIPIPYEIGVLFMAIPQAIVDVAIRDTKASEAVKGIGKLLWQSAPGVVPVGAKPWLEAFYGQTAFGPIENQREKMLAAGERYRPGTTEVAKALGSFTGVVGVSPLMLEHFVKSYTSMLGISALHMLDPVFATGAGGEKASTPASKQPFVGGLFHSAEGRFLIDRAYERMDDIVQASNTYEGLLNKGQRAEARAFAQRQSNLIAMKDEAGAFRQEMGELFSEERAIRDNPRLTTAQKDERLDRLKRFENKIAERFYKQSERTTRQ